MKISTALHSFKMQDKYNVYKGHKQLGFTERSWHVRLVVYVLIDLFSFKGQWFHVDLVISELDSSLPPMIVRFFI